MHLCHMREISDSGWIRRQRPNTFRPRRLINNLIATDMMSGYDPRSQSAKDRVQGRATPGETQSTRGLDERSSKVTQSDLKVPDVARSMVRPVRSNLGSLAGILDDDSIPKLCLYTWILSPGMCRSPGLSLAMGVPRLQGPDFRSVPSCYIVHFYRLRHNAVSSQDRA